MRFLADENFPGDGVAALRRQGHDVVWVLEAQPGTDDEFVLRRASRESRVLLTFDKDFGELVFRGTFNPLPGVVLFRISVQNVTVIVPWLVGVLESREDWARFFSVVEENRVRMTDLHV